MIPIRTYSNFGDWFSVSTCWESLKAVLRMVIRFCPNYRLARLKGDHETPSRTLDVSCRLGFTIIITDDHLSVLAPKIYQTYLSLYHTCCNSLFAFPFQKWLTPLVGNDCTIKIESLDKISTGHPPPLPPTLPISETQTSCTQIALTFIIIIWSKHH